MANAQFEQCTDKFYLIIFTPQLLFDVNQLQNVLLLISLVMFQRFGSYLMTTVFKYYFLY